MSASGLGPARLLLVVVLAVSIPLLGGYMAKVYGERQGAGRPRASSRSSGSIYRVCRVDPDQRAALDRLRVLGARVQRRRHDRPVRDAAAPDVAAVQPDARAEGRRGALVQHRGRASSTNTNWQSYYPESTLSHFTQMVGLDGAELRLRRGRHGGRWPRSIRGLARRRVRHDRQLLGRPHADDASDPPADRVRRRVRSTSAPAWSRTSHGFEVVKTLEGNTQVIPGGPAASQEIDQDARHERWRVLQRRTPRTRSRTRTASRTCSGSTCILGDPVRAHLHVREDGRRASGRAGCSSR